MNLNDFFIAFFFPGTRVFNASTKSSKKWNGIILLYMIEPKARTIFERFKSEALGKEYKNKKEKGSLIKLVEKSELLINDAIFMQRLVFIHEYIRKNTFFNRQELVTLIKHICTKYNAMCCRQIEKFSFTREITIAIYYDSWWPFIASTTIDMKTRKSLTLNIKKGTQYKDRENKLVTLDAIIEKIPVERQKKREKEKETCIFDVFVPF